MSYKVNGGATLVGVIGSLDSATTKDDRAIREAFERFGNIVSLQVKAAFAFLVS
jgi:hypothetical protein